MDASRAQATALKPPHFPATIGQLDSLIERAAATRSTLRQTAQSVMGLSFPPDPGQPAGSGPTPVLSHTEAINQKLSHLYNLLADIQDVSQTLSTLA